MHKNQAAGTLELQITWTGADTSSVLLVTSGCRSGVTPNPQSIASTQMPPFTPACHPFGSTLPHPASPHWLRSVCRLLTCTGPQQGQMQFPSPHRQLAHLLPPNQNNRARTARVEGGSKFGHQQCPPT
eukprot:6466095-Pyramimonas_sp.AAC.1